MMEKNKNSFDMKKLLSSRSLKYGSNSLILIVVVIAIAVIVNMLFSPAVLQKVIGREALKLDLTPNKLYSLGDKTDEVMKGINKDVKVYALYDEAKIKDDAELKEVDEILKQYTKYPHIKLEYVDLDKNPTFITGLDPEGLKEIGRNDIVFAVGKKVKKLSQYDFFSTQFDQQSFQSYKTGSSAEQSITGAIKYVTSDKTPVVYFLTGHDEKKADTDYKSVNTYLLNNNYEVKSLNLATEAKVPDDAEILVVTAPKKDLTTQEKDKLKDYFKNGGKALFAFDTLDTNPKFANFEEVLSTFNVSINYDRVLENDDNRHIKNKPYDIFPVVQDNTINAPINPQSLLVYMPQTRSVNVLKNDKEYITVTSLMKTSNKAVGEVLDPTKGKNTQGPLDLAVAVENKGGSKVSKIVVMGNASFMTDSAISQYEQYAVSGLYFFLNSLNWMQEQKDEVIIAPKTYSRPMLQMSEMTANVLAVTSVIVLPLIILGFGTFVWMRRRHL